MLGFHLHSLLARKKGSIAEHVRRALLSLLSGSMRLWQGESEDTVVAAVMAACTHY